MYIAETNLLTDRRGLLKFPLLLPENVADTGFGVAHAGKHKQHVADPIQVLEQGRRNLTLPSPTKG